MKQDKRMKRTYFITRRPRPDSRRALKERLDTLVRQVVRQEEPFCVTCGSSQNLTLSHFYRRANFAVRYSLENCHMQCADCHLRHDYDTAPYLEYLIGRYGAEVVSSLNQRRLENRKATDVELEEWASELELRLKRKAAA